MARFDRVNLPAVTCPPGTLQVNAIETDLSFPPGRLVGLEIVIPPGHAGATGLAIAQAHQIVIPTQGTQWLVGDDDIIRWDYKDVLGSGQWSAFTYNLDLANSHTWFFRMLIAENSTVVSSGLLVAAPPISTDDIAAAAAADAAGNAQDTATEAEGLT